MCTPYFYESGCIVEGYKHCHVKLKLCQAKFFIILMKKAHTWTSNNISTCSFLEEEEREDTLFMCQARI